jgi:protein translocase SecG subunit
MELQQLLQLADIILSVLIIALVLLQRSGADVGAAFGGGDASGSITYTRRGFEKVLFVTTIVAGILFVVINLALLKLPLA